MRTETLHTFRTLMLSLLVCALLTPLAHADDDHGRGGWPPRKTQHNDYFYKDRREHPNWYRMDERYRHDHYYPRHGYVVTALPRHYDRIRYRDRDYFYFSGVWYINNGVSFQVIAPPIGIIVPVLPSFYTTLWIGGIPYYYANNTYYVWRPDQSGYEVTEPPSSISQEQPTPVTDQLYVYPMKGQTAKQQADDRFACHEWSVKQTGFDPSLPPQNMGAQAMAQKREDYQRAMRACLEGRGYSVR